MSEYIDKSAVVAEIERIKREECPIDTYEGRCKLFWFEQFLSFLNTLEVKDVDLEEEVDKWYNNEAPKEFEHILYREIENFAKHFFELGLKVQKEE